MVAPDPMAQDQNPGTGPPGGEVIRARDIHYEVAIDPEPAASAALAEVGETEADTDDERLPLRPDWMHAEDIRHLSGALAYRGLCHVTRTPEYVLFMLMWAPVGLARLAGLLLRWQQVHEQRPLRHQAASAGDSREWMRLHREAKETRKIRGIILLAATTVLTVAVAWLVTRHTWWSLPVLATAALIVLPWLAHYGHPADRPIIRPVVVTPRFRIINADIILRAYYAAGLGSPDKPDQQITFGSTMQRDGEGSRVQIDLPYGKGLKDAVEVKDRIASGLDVTESQVYLHRDRTSYRRHTLWVADRDPLAVPVGKTPLLNCRQTDIWKSAPIGLDERGQVVKLPILFHSTLIGALPRMGKSWTARQVALYAALDPYCRLSVFDAGGKPDWRKFAMVADRYAFGLTPSRDGKPPEILRDTLEQIRRDVEDRYERLSSLPTSVCPEGKLTRDIARDPRYRMPVRLVVLDEVQEYFELGQISGDIAELLVYLVKVAPAAGVALLDATQRPSGIGSGGEVAKRFTAFRDMHQLRFSLRTPDWRVSEMVLGAGSLGEGADSSKLLPEYKGVGILRGASDATPTVRCFEADDQDAEVILTASRGLRERAGTLSGMAASQDAPGVRDVLADVLAVLGADPGLHWDVLAGRLAAQLPERWADASGDALSAQCRALGVPSVDVRYPSGRAGAIRKGCRRSDVEAATRNTAGQEA